MLAQFRQRHFSPNFVPSVPSEVVHQRNLIGLRKASISHGKHINEI